MRRFSDQIVGRPVGALSRCLRITRPARVLVRILFFALLRNSVQAMQAVSLAWDPSSGTDVAGYNVYAGVVSHTYTSIVDVGKTTYATLSGLTEGTTYFFAAKAYNSFGLESDYSNEASYTVPISTARLQVRAVPTGQAVLTVTGKIGQKYDILATQNFTTWTVIGTVTVGAGGWLDFADTNAASFPRRYYRTRENP
jgi:Fibronectin type III domain